MMRGMGVLGVGPGLGLGLGLGLALVFGGNAWADAGALVPASTVRTVVVDDEDDTPAAFETDIAPKGIYQIRLENEDHLAYRRTTDPDGFCRIEDIVPGSYTVSVVKVDTLRSDARETFQSAVELLPGRVTHWNGKPNTTRENRNQRYFELSRRLKEAVARAGYLRGATRTESEAEVHEKLHALLRVAESVPAEPASADPAVPTGPVPTEAKPAANHYPSAAHPAAVPAKDEAPLFNLTLTEPGSPR